MFNVEDRPSVYVRPAVYVVRCPQLKRVSSHYLENGKWENVSTAVVEKADQGQHETDDISGEPPATRARP